MPVIGFQVTEAQKQEIETLAGGNLSAYLRRVVFAHLVRDHSLEIILQRLDRMETQMELNSSKTPKEPGSTEGASLPDEVVGWLLEMLLMLRVAMPDDRREFAQAEVKRLGLPIFESK